MHYCSQEVIMRSKKVIGLCILLSALPGYYSSNAYGAAELKCGKIGKYVLEVPEKLVIAWHEEQDQIVSGASGLKKRTSCDAAISKFSLAMTWPERKLVDRMDYTINGKMFESVLFSLARLERVDDKTKREVKAFLGLVIKESDRPVQYSEKLDMFVVQLVERSDPDSARVYYWQERNGEIAALFECLWSIELKKFYLCRGNVAFAEEGLTVDMLFSEEKILEWQKVVSAIKEVVLSKAKS